MRKDTDIIRRSRIITSGKRGDGAVLYWMDRDQRLTDNWALLYAQQEAIVRSKPLRIITFISPDSLKKKSPQTIFQLHGLAELYGQAQAQNIGFSVVTGDAARLLPEIVRTLDAHLLVGDFSPLLKKQRQVKDISNSIPIPFVEVDSHNIIPAWTVSSRKEYAAYTLRPKIHLLLEDYLTDIPSLVRHPAKVSSLGNGNSPCLDDNHLAFFRAGTVGDFVPGGAEAEVRMNKFLRNGLAAYAENRNNPNLTGQSDLSPYLHFGQLAPQRLAYEVLQSNRSRESKESFLEELVVRRELADNFCLYETNYLEFSGFPSWAQKSLNEHRGDSREHLYNLGQLEHAKTHEELWNSCQRELTNTHKLHGYLRMYWAKKILEWTGSPEEALAHAIYLNDTYSLDGSDPNGYAGIAWSIGGVHDRAWPERPVFGKIRYMNERGCRRKFDVDTYIARHPI